MAEKHVTLWPVSLAELCELEERKYTPMKTEEGHPLEIEASGHSRDEAKRLLIEKAVDLGADVVYRTQYFDQPRDTAFLARDKPIVYAGGFAAKLKL